MKAKSSLSFSVLVKYRKIERYKACDDERRKKKKKEKKRKKMKYEDRKKEEEQLANNVNGIIYVVKIREQCWLWKSIMERRVSRPPEMKNAEALFRQLPP